MIKKIKGYTVKFTAGMVLAATLMSTASMAASASGLQVQAKGSVVATQPVASVTASDVASVTGNDVVSVSANNVVRVGAGKTDDAVVEDQGNMNSSQYAVDSVVDENADWHEGDGDMNPFHKYYQKARDMVANINRMNEVRKAEEEARKAREEQQAEESRRAEQFKKAEEAKLEEYAKKVHEDRIAKEGQGDVIDDQFAYVEGQGDVIDDQFAVATDETVNVADNNTEATAPSVNSFVAVGSVDCAKASKDDVDAKIKKKIEDCEIKRAYDLYKIPQENKSHLTKALENFVDGFDLYKDDKNRVCNAIDSQDKFGVAEKEYLKELTKIGYGALNGFVTKEIIPGIGPVKKAAQALASFSKAKDAKGFAETTVQVMDGVKNSLQTVIAIIPGGGGLINSAVDAVGSTVKYATAKIWSWFS